MNVLIVEDNQEMRRLLRSFLEDDVEQIHECADGSAACAAYARHHPDWVLMDLKMAVMDGITATRQIKAAFPEARIMIVTDYDDIELRRKARRAGAAAYVLKEDLSGVRQILKP